MPTEAEQRMFSAHKAETAELERHLAVCRDERKRYRVVVYDIANGLTLAEDADEWRHAIIGKARAALSATPETSDGAAGEGEA